MPTAEVISLLSQAPLAVILIVAGYYLMKENNKRDVEWRDFFREVGESQGEALKALATSNQDAMGKMARQVEKLTEQVAKNTAVIILHDATVKGQNPETIGTTEDIIRKLLNGD